MIHNECEYLVHLIRSAICDEQPMEKPESVSFEKVFELGKFHEVANMAFVAVEKLHHKPDPTLLTKWKIHYALSIQRHANQMKARSEIVDALNAANIRNVEVQGTIMKTLYPYPEWRMMSDIDFIIDKSDLEPAEAVMKKLGYKTHDPNGAEIDAFGPNNAAVELHTDFFDPGSICYGTITDVFSTSQLTQNGVSYKADDTTFVLYNILHCIKHHLDLGAGIRRILDIYFLNIKLSDKIEIEYINEVLTKFDYKHIYDDLVALAFEWFGGKPCSYDLNDIKRQVCLSGTHGSMTVQLSNEYAKVGDVEKRYVKFKKYLFVLFPSKATIYAKYPFCKAHRLPLLFCWVYRWGRILTIATKRKKAIGVLKEIKNTKMK